MKQSFTLVRTGPAVHLKRDERTSSHLVTTIKYEVDKKDKIVPVLN
jgi:hypothetical protein